MPIVRQKTQRITSLHTLQNELSSHQIPIFISLYYTVQEQILWSGSWLRSTTVFFTQCTAALRWIISNNALGTKYTYRSMHGNNCSWLLRNTHLVTTFPLITPHQRCEEWCIESNLERNVHTYISDAKSVRAHCPRKFRRAITFWNRVQEHRAANAR